MFASILIKRVLDIKDSMTVHRGKSPGTAFTNKMLQFVGFMIHADPPFLIHGFPFRLAKYQVQAIYCDLELNTLRCVYFNLYTGFLLCGMKMHEHLRTSDLIVSESTKLILGRFERCPVFLFTADWTTAKIR